MLIHFEQAAKKTQIRFGGIHQKNNDPTKLAHTVMGDHGDQARAETYLEELIIV